MRFWIEAVAPAGIRAAPAALRPARRFHARYACALLASAGVHLGVGALLGRGEPAHDNGAPASRPGASAIALRIQRTGAALAGTKERPAARLAQAAAPPGSAGTPAPTSNPVAERAGAPRPDRHAPPEPAAIPTRARYYLPSELEEKPRIRRNLDPALLRVLPDAAPRPVGARLYLDERGEVERVALEDSMLSPPAERFVIEALGTIRFYPGRLAGEAVKSRLRIVVTLESIARSPRPGPRPAD